VGKTVDEAVYLFAALDRQCQVQLLTEAAAANGIPKTIISKEDADYTAQTIQWWENTYINVSLKIACSAGSETHNRLSPVPTGI